MNNDLIRKTIKEAFVDKETNITASPVEINYNGSWLQAIEIAYSYGGMLKMSYLMIDNTAQYDFHDISNGKPYHEVVKKNVDLHKWLE